MKHRQLLTLFRFGTELLGKIPTRNDTLPEIATKALAIADAAERVYGGKKTLYSDVLTRYDLKEKHSEAFVRLFWGSQMHTRFKIKRHGVDEHLELIEAQSSDGERLFFQEHRYGRPEMSSDFFHTPKFNFARASEALWQAYPTGLYLSTQQGRWTSEVTFEAIPKRTSCTMTQRSRERVSDAVAGHAARNRSPWCFVAVGSPGTGKSSFVETFAQVTDARLLKIDAASLPKLGVQEFGLLLDVMRPNVLLIDDADRAPVEEVRARILFLFEYLRNRSSCTIAITVNDPTKLDPALYRSERIDEVIDFEAPDDNERREIFDSVLGHVSNHNDAVNATAGFGHADVAGFARRLRNQPFDIALKQMQRLRALAEQAQNAGQLPQGVVTKTG
jgi:hypothetical protein